ncbi:DUF6907 domain-containing protein [Streptomyces sp. NPDC096205]|uniref:DUF6907 domain-containing protein n=1 Tax=Streptomyces sp. NPDC096205 TaxID=3366081 RepID=UPI00381E27DB
MAMKAQPPLVAKAPSPLPERAITASLTAEIMRDLDTGQHTLVAYSGGNASDISEITPAQLLARVSAERARLDAIERLAIEYADAANTTSDEPHTWSFTHSGSGASVPVTCMPGCTMNHSLDTETPSHPVDVYCWTDPVATATLPLDNTGSPEEYNVLSTRIEVDPFAPDMARRQPFAVVEFIDEHYIGGLDPDALAAVIRTVSNQLTAMRQAHTRLVQIRGQYLQRTEAQA